MICNFFWAILGGLVTSVLIPLSSYFVIRKINRRGIEIESTEFEQDGYKETKLILKNTANTTLRNVIAHITINNGTNDIIPGFKNIFCKHGQVKYALLSWCKDVDNKNYPSIDINQGEFPDLNLIRYYPNRDIPCIEIASEKGFSDKELGTSSISRVVLNVNQDYLFDIIFTGNNFFPIEKKYRFQKSEAKLIEV